VQVQDGLDVLMEDLCLQWLKQPNNRNRDIMYIKTTTTPYRYKHKKLYVNQFSGEINEGNIRY